MTTFEYRLAEILGRFCGIDTSNGVLFTYDSDDGDYLTWVLEGSGGPTDERGNRKDNHHCFEVWRTMRPTPRSALASSALKYGLINAVVETIVDEESWFNYEEEEEEELEGMMSRGEIIDPITIYRRASDGRLAIADGRLAFKVAKKLGWKYIPAVVLTNIG
jgi:hypothetical protein